MGAARADPVAADLVAVEQALETQQLRVAQHNKRSALALLALGVAPMGAIAALIITTPKIRNCKTN